MLSQHTFRWQKAATHCTMPWFKSVHPSSNGGHIMRYFVILTLTSHCPYHHICTCRRLPMNLTTFTQHLLTFLLSRFSLCKLPPGPQNKPVMKSNLSRQSSKAIMTWYEHLAPKTTLSRKQGDPTTRTLALGGAEKLCRD